MKLGSLFDGIGGFPLAASMLGIEPVWASEIEKFPIAVTKIRFPNMKHLGSVCDIKGAEVEPVDIITFGSPCQDLSVAGKRAGMGEGTRSGLFSEAVRIIKEMRDASGLRNNGHNDHEIRRGGPAVSERSLWIKTNDSNNGGTNDRPDADGDNGTNRYPRYAVWENVPGAFSSNKGEDFRSVLESLAKVADPEASIPMPRSHKWQPAGMVRGRGWSIAWRTLDAQFWGVPQRRKRIFIIADFGGDRASEIFFEREGVSWNPTQSGDAGQEAAGGVEGGVRATSRGTPIVFDARGNGNGETSPTITGDHQNRITDYTAILMNAEGGNGATLPAANLGKSLNNQTPLAMSSTVRRLTPTECSRLQGYPDGWCDIEGASDSAKYKALGNSVAIPCVYFILSCLIRSER